MVHQQQQQWPTQAVLPASTPPVSGHQAPQWPKEGPFSPNEENIDRLQEWLLQHFSGTTLNIKRHPLPIMEGKPHHIHLKENTVPYACNTHADVAKYWKAEVKQQLDKDISLISPSNTTQLTAQIALFRSVCAGLLTVYIPELICIID